MKNQLSKILLIVSLLILGLAACQSTEAEDGPADVYWAYYEACKNGKYETASSYLDEQAKMQINTVGACGFTHDAVNRYEAEIDGSERTFSEEPVIEVLEDKAALSWLDDLGNLAVVNMKMEDGWKIAFTIWSK